jgi:SAM-dependent methyltransferase
MTDLEIRTKAESFGKWYHELQLTPSFRTPSLPFQDVWEQIQSVRDTIDYKDKTVLDLGSMDGRWAFDAENRKARAVVASDIWPNPRLLFAREVFKSNITVVPNADIHCLVDRMRSSMAHLGIHKFDIVQCMGLIYHVQNPMLGFHQIRQLIAPDGVMLLETGAWTGGGDEPLARLNRGKMLYQDGSTYWMMNLACIEQVLGVCGFQLDRSTLKRFGQWQGTERICGLVRPIPVTHSLDDFGAH